MITMFEQSGGWKPPKEEKDKKSHLKRGSK